MSLIRLPKHYKETVISKPNAIANGLANAAQTATKFITEISNSGIWVTPDGAQPSESGSALPTTTGWHISDAIELFKQGASYFKIWLENSVTKVRVGLESSGHALFTPNGMDIFNGGESVAEFGGNGARIGKATGESRIVQDYHSMQMVDKENKTYFHVSDLRGSDGLVSVTDTFVAESNGANLQLAYQASSLISVTSNGTDVTSGCTLTETTVYAGEVSYLTSVLHGSWAAGATVVCTYTTNSELTKGLTFGVRGSAAIGGYSSSFGYGNNVSGFAAFASGQGNSATGISSYAEGYNNTASGKFSHAEGTGTTASDYYSHAEGRNTTASYPGAHAEGYDTTASSWYSHAEGYSTTASRQGSHAEGYGTTASGYYSHTGGYRTTAAYDSQTAIGKYNDNQSDNAFEIGNGTSDTARSNAFEVAWDGTVTAAGELFGAATAEDMTINNAASAVTTRSARRAAGVVTLHVVGLKLASALANNAASGIVLTVPDGFRPSETAYAQVVTSGHDLGSTYARIGTDGAVTIRNQSGASIPTSYSLAFTLTYVM